ncbi:MAG: hypothetical protein HFF02_08750 [Erysipelotrichaceae bacterium]|nr:hypothetical protein [Erysipelotrichaceae bacterium]
MSKHLFEAGETVENTAPMCNSTPVAFNIRLMDQDAMGNSTSADDIRYIRISDSSGSDQIHPMRLANGEAYIRLEDMNAAQFTLVQVDENGNQMINGDAFAISYMVDGKIQDEDYARVYDTCNDEVTITILNMPIAPLTLHVVKVLYDEFGEVLEPNPNMNFTVTITGMGCSEVIDLNCDNDFHVTLDSLSAGIYDVYEIENDCFDTTYAFDGAKPSTCEQFSMYSGCHTLEIINRRRPSTVLTLDKYIRDANGELIKPRNSECFKIRVLGDYYDQIFELNEDNDFAIDVCELPPGLYDVMETDTCCYDVSYLVNAASESPYAHVELKSGCAASVLIINSVQCAAQESPLRICKYIRRSDNCLVKPDPCDSFKVMLSGCGTCEIFNLNAGNNFCVDIEHICCGEYEVKELDHDDYQTSYIVNDGCETTSACLYVHEGSFHNVTIINEERNKGEVTISKVIRGKDGTINKPDKSKRFLVTLRSFFCRETFVLDASNDFCVHVYHLKEGSYEVKERPLDAYDTTYVIDNGKEMRKARFLVTNDRCSDIKIINSMKKEQSGDLRICKYIANAYGDYVKPSADEEYEIQVQGPCVENCYTLRASNNWCVILEDLKKGVYRVTECPNIHYDAQYFVNGCEMEEAALVCMEKENQEVNIVNTRRSNGNLKLSVVVEDCDDLRHKPNMSEYFDIIVETASGSKIVRLDERNNFGVLLEDLEQGRIRITQKDSYGYRVSYEVDGVRTNKAVAEMRGSNVSVTMINRTMDCAGMVRVRKFVETLSGRIIKPCDDDCYTFTLSSRCMNNEYRLNAQNDFCVIFDDLEEDDYEIKEACVEGMKTRYRINGEESLSGKFNLAIEDLDIEIINTVLPLPVLEVNKRIRECGELVKPQSWESFNFQLIGRGVHETYCLNADNDWCVQIEGLNNQHYEIRELDVNCPVSYQINRNTYEKGTFLFQNEDLKVTIINEAPSEAVVNICQWVRDENGEVMKPCREDCFEITLENDCFKQCFTLNHANDWCVNVEGLASGRYQLKCRGASQNEVWVDGQPQENGYFTLEQCDVDVSLIQPFGCDNALIIQAETLRCEKRQTPNKDKSYHVHVEHEGVCDTFVLDQTNDWCIELANICLGDYRIYADEDVIYENDGQCYQQCIDIQMNCETCSVTLLEELPEHGDMLITKRIQYQDGTFHKPPCGSRFNILLIGSCEECFELNEENDWTMRLCKYPFGNYEVIEQASSCARYQINQGAIKKHGRFRLEADMSKITIINPMQADDCFEESGSLTVHAMVKNCDGDLMSAPVEARFEVMVDGTNFREDVTLTERNGFARTFHHLPKGKLLITQKPNPDFTRVTYRIHGLEQPVGEIDLGASDVHVDLINYSVCKQGSIRVGKYIKDAGCGCLKRPCMDEEYTIALIKDEHIQRVVLNASNKWSYEFTQLARGTYQIVEETSEDVTYIINGGKEQGEAFVDVDGNVANVKVINPASESVHGSIELCKYVRNASGEESTPQNQSYWISVIGENSSQRVLLHDANHYYAEVRHLAPGVYEVKEEEQNGAVYRVNNAVESNRAIVSVNGNQNSVDIVNMDEISKTSLLLEKWIMDEQGALKKPEDGVYRIHVSAPGYNEVYTLNAENAFTYRIQDLAVGLYVIDELDHDQVTYMIDGGTPVDRAIVQVSARHEVMIVNPTTSSHTGSIRLTKYIRTSSGTLARPHDNASYQFHVSKPGFNEIYTLDAQNNWSTTIVHLENGNYVVSEMNAEGKVSYMINEGSETDFGIVNVNQDQNIVSIINSETDNNGSITITKYIRDEEGGLHRPDGNYSTSVHVSRPGYNEVFTLNRSNNWQIRILDLMDGQYILDELDSEDEVTWRINGGSEVRYAVVNVSRNDNQVDMINTKINNGNTLKLRKFIRNTSNQLIKPNRDESFTVLISGAKTMRVVLNKENDWQSTISELPNGMYHIKESSSNYEVTYVVNDGEEKDSASVQLTNQDVEITLINTMRGSRNVLELSKYIKTSQGALITPVEGDVYQIEVSGPNFLETYRLTHENAFSVRLNNLSNGNYTVKEAGNSDYVITYRVNGGQETSSAMVTVSEGKTNIVEIINERTIDHNSLEVFKYLMDQQGNFQQPSASQVYRFLLTGSNLHQFYTLNEANKWHVRVEGLADGEYEVIEQGGGTNVQYLVDGADFSSTGEFVAKGGSENIVEIVNVEQNSSNGSIQIEKKIRNTNGDLTIPGNGESFSIRIFSNDQNYDEIFTLDELNGYALQVDHLAFGEYHVEEIENSGFNTTYVVNDETENTTAVLQIQSDAVQNVIVINTQMSLYLQVKDRDDIRITIE